MSRVCIGTALKCVCGWVGGEGGLFDVCLKSGHTTNNLPCVFGSTHGENLHMIKFWTNGKLTVSVVHGVGIEEFTLGMEHAPQHLPWTPVRPRRRGRGPERDMRARGGRCPGRHLRVPRGVPPSPSSLRASAAAARRLCTGKPRRHDADEEAESTRRYWGPAAEAGGGGSAET